MRSTADVRPLSMGTSVVEQKGRAAFSILGEGQGGELGAASGPLSFDVLFQYGEWSTESVGRNGQVVTGDKSSLVAVRHLQVLASLLSLVRLLPRKRSAHAPYPGQRHSQGETPAITA